MLRPMQKLFRLMVGTWHVIVGLVLVAVTSGIIAHQVESRMDFAATELVKDVESRWGAPVVQPAPSVRFVESGSIFTELAPLALDWQHVRVEARMNYRKKGLRYFSGFDFLLTAQYGVRNPEAHDIDVAFVFPIEVDKSQVLLSDLDFRVNGAKAALDLGADRNRLVWTGRVEKGQGCTFSIRYRARGLEQFVYRLDPALPARDTRLSVNVQGGANYDYPDGVLAATSVSQRDDGVTLDWTFPSLESGVTLGIILPSEKTFDAIVGTMARRAWAPFLVLIALLSALARRHARPLCFYESYLVAAVFGFFFVLLAYLGAFMNFYLAYAISTLGLGAALTAYLRAIFSAERVTLLCGLWASTMIVPTLAVVLQGYTGLIYTIEILAALLGLMVLTTRRGVRAFLAAPWGVNV